MRCKMEGYYHDKMVIRGDNIIICRRWISGGISVQGAVHNAP